MPRLFTALEIPRNAAMSLSLLRGGLPGARWIDVENYHITLRFIGDVDGRTADEMVDRLDRDRPRRNSSSLSTASVPSGRRSRIRSGPAFRPTPEMYALQAEIERICQRIGLPPDPRKFTPHVTLARLRIRGSTMWSTILPGAAISTPPLHGRRASCCCRRKEFGRRRTLSHRRGLPAARGRSAPSFATTSCSRSRACCRRPRNPSSPPIIGIGDVFAPCRTHSR